MDLAEAAGRKQAHAGVDVAREIALRERRLAALDDAKRRLVQNI